MTTYLGKSCSFGLPRVPFVNCRQFMYLVISLLVLRTVCDLIVSAPDHCLSFYFVIFITNYWWFRILEISRYRRSNGSVLKDTR